MIRSTQLPLPTAVGRSCSYSNLCSTIKLTALFRTQENYGSWDDAKVARVKALYKDLDLEKLYHKYEEESYSQIMALRPNVEGLLPWSIFEIFLGKVYKRRM